MRTLVSAIVVAAVSLLGVEMAYAGAPDYLFGIQIKWYGLLLLIVQILSLLCCWYHRNS